MTTSRKRGPIDGCSSSNKKRNTGECKVSSSSDSDSDELFGVPDPGSLVKEFIYPTKRAMVMAEVLADVPFLIERPNDDDSFTEWGYKQVLKDRELLGTVRLPKNINRVWFEKNVVREFYANLDPNLNDGESDLDRRVYIRGGDYQFNPTLLNQILGTRDGGGSPLRVCDVILVREMTGGKIRYWPEAGLRRSQLTRFYKVLHEIGCSNWFPTNDVDNVSVDQAVILYHVGTGKEFNLGEYIFRRILEDAQNVPAVMCFPILIYTLLTDQNYRAPNHADLNLIEPVPIRVTPELDELRSLMVNQVNVISYEVATLQTQIQSFFQDAPNELPGPPPA